MPTPSRRTQKQRAAEASDKLIAATIELVASRGVDGFALADVAQAAKVSRGLPVHHFKTREHLVEQAMLRVLKPRGLPTAPGLQELLASLRRSLGRVRRPHVKALLAVLSSPRTTSATKAHVKAYLGSAERLVEAHLRAGIAAGHLRRQLNPVTTARWLLSAVLGEALSASSSDSEVEGRVRAEAFLGFVQFALAKTRSPAAAKTSRRKASATESRPDLFDEGT